VHETTRLRWLIIAIILWCRNGSLLLLLLFSVLNWIENIRKCCVKCACSYTSVYDTHTYTHTHHTPTSTHQYHCYCVWRVYFQFSGETIYLRVTCLFLVYTVPNGFTISDRYRLMASAYVRRSLDSFIRLQILKELTNKSVSCVGNL